MTRLPAPWGSRINRDKPVSFRFEGQGFTGFEGDVIASALAANDQWMLSRSFKYHRPAWPPVHGRGRGGYAGTAAL